MPFSFEGYARDGRFSFCFSFDLIVFACDSRRIEDRNRDAKDDDN
jgi:hypothetical protein